MKYPLVMSCCFLAILLISSCSDKNEKNDSLVLVDIEANIDNMQPVNLSQFTDDVRYVPLENIEDYPLTGLSQVDISDKLILVSGGGHCLLYDTDGHFISKIGNKGRGPGEYSVAAYVGLGGGDEQKIYISSTFDLFEYNIDGSFVMKYTNTFLIDDIYYLRYRHLINDSLFFGSINNGTGDVEYKAMIVSKDGNVVHSFKNYIRFNIESSNAFGGQTQIFQFKDALFFKEEFNDTLFSINDKYEAIPRYLINMGKYQLPLSIRLTRPMGERIMDYIFMSNIFQTEDYLFLNCNFGNRSPAKRLTPRQSPFPGGGLLWINTNAVLGVFNKNTGELVFCKPSDTDNPLFTSGLYNDIDCGPRFRPLERVDDSTLAMWVRADELLNHVASDDFKNGVPKYPEKKKELEDLAHRLSVLDNPVLMFVTFNN